MKIRTSLIVSGFASLVFLSGCTFTSLTVPASGIGQIEFEPLNSNEYEILGDAEGEATVGYVLFFPFGDFQEKGWIGSAFSLSGWAHQAAVYKAIESVPEADAILVPRSKGSGFKLFPLFGKQTVTVKGKAIKILKK